MAKTAAHTIILFSLIICVLNAPNISLISKVGSPPVQQSGLKPERPSSDSGDACSILQTMRHLEEFEEEGDLIINASDYPGENDTERLQAALNDVPPEGATVFIPSGTWIACGLTAKSKTNIVGGDETVISRPDSTTAPFLTFENCSNFAVSELVFEGKGTKNAYGILIRNGKSFKVDQCVFQNLEKSAVKVTISLYGISENFIVTSNLFMNCHDAPILIFGTPNERAIRYYAVWNNTITGGTANGKIGTAFSTDGFISNNTVSNCEFGIATRCVSKTTITGNLVRNATSYGVYLGTQIGDPGTDNVIVENNVIIGSNTGISRYYGSYPIRNVLIENNQFINNTLYDILADFPATYINNTITSRAKLSIKDTGAVFAETRTIADELIVPGDINCDCRIDIKDLGFIARRYGSLEGSPDWDARADVIDDGCVDIKDISYVSRDFGFIAE